MHATSLVVQPLQGYGLTVRSYGEAVSYERGTPVSLRAAVRVWGVGFRDVIGIYFKGNEYRGTSIIRNSPLPRTLQ